MDIQPPQVQGSPRTSTWTYPWWGLSIGTALCLGTRTDLGMLALFLVNSVLYQLVVPFGALVLASPALLFLKARGPRTLALNVLVFVPYLAAAEFLSQGRYVPVP